MLPEMSRRKFLWSSLGLQLTTLVGSKSHAYFNEAGSLVSPKCVSPHNLPDGFRSGLNSQFTFSNFVIARRNEFAHAACYSAARKFPRLEYSPLFICGANGIESTHLLHAVGNLVKEKQPQTKLKLVSCERFLNECGSSFMRNEMSAFRNLYRESYDLLLIDDVQNLARSEVAQKEFFEILYFRAERGLSVALSSDRMPKAMKGLDSRNRRHLESGLIADISMADLESAKRIARVKAARLGANSAGEGLNF